MVTRSAQELQNDTARAIEILKLFTDPGKRDVKMLIPQSVLAEAHGLIFIRLYRGGFMVSAKKGTGIIIARLPDGSWSAPSGISMGAVGFGHQAGVEVIDSIIVMNYRGAVKSFYDGGGQLQLGANVSISAGPLGRAANVAAGATSAQHIAATYAYSASKGLFAGYSFEGSKVSERVNTNAAFYGRRISAQEILTGTVPPPPVAQPLYDILASLGAGRRQGMPFAPKKGRTSMPPPQQQQYHQQPYQSQPSFHQPQQPYPSSQPPLHQPQSSAPPAQAFNDHPSSFQKPAQQAHVGFEEPPPPYSPASNENMYATGDVKQTPASAGAQDATSSSSNAAPGYSASSGYEHYYGNDTKKNGMVEQQQTVVVAKYDFHGEQAGDLTFSAGDHIIVTQRKGDRQAWWQGEIGNRKGMFPANYTEDMV